MVYRHVVDDVIKNMRTEFISEGVGVDVLNELQTLWETKLLSNESMLPMGYTGEDMAHAYNLSSYSYPVSSIGLDAASDISLYASSSVATDIDPQFGKPQEYLPPPTNHNWGVGQVTVVPSDVNERAAALPRSIVTGRPVSQFDGGDDEDEDEEEQGTNGNGTGQTVKDEDELGSDLDDEEEDEEPDTDNIILCQFEKVTRIKNKRKCTLKAGVMHLNGRDYLFNKANGEFEW